MTRYIALLRGINVGGHRVKMDELRRLFEELGLSRVETVIASGNVVFETAETDARRLEHDIERHLARALGYEAPTFLRTVPELAGVAAQKHFDLSREPEGSVVYVLFLRDRPGAGVVKALRELDTANDEARAGKREVYWLRRGRVKDSDVFGAKLGALLGTEVTSRNLNTVQRIVEKYK